MAKNVICLWYDGTAEDAARFYAQTFPDSAVTAVHRAPGDYPDGKQGQVLTVEFSAHLIMNVFERRARSHFLFGLGDNVPRSVCVDCPTREFTRGNALASAHLTKLLHALAWHEVCYVIIKPDFPECIDDFGFLWFEDEAVVAGSTSWVVAGNAADAIAKELK
jgi:hypothetical protein